MRQQTQHIQVFLNKTAILNKFNSDICKSLTEFDDCQEILQYLEKANLFVFSLDNESSWYRYHHLFADYLRAGLSKSESTDLNKIAAVWFENNGSVFDSIHHALASDDADFTAGLMERVLERGHTWSGGHLTTLLHWIDAIPQSTLYARPYLCMLAVPIVCAAVRFDQAEQLLHHTEIALKGQENSEGNRLQALVVFYRGGIALMRGEISKAIEFTNNAQKLFPVDDFLFQSRVASNLAQAYELSGQTENAVKYYQKASELGFAAEATYLAVNARCTLAFALRSQGKIQLAIETLMQTIDMFSLKQIPPIGVAYIMSGIIAYDQNELKKAEELLQQGIDLARAGGLIDDMNWGLVFMAFVKSALGEHDSALAIMKQSLMMIHSYHIPRVSLLVSAFQAQLFLATHQIEKANIWAEEYLRVRIAESVEYNRETEDLTLVRIFLRIGNFSQIPMILDPLLESARNAGRNKISVEGLILLSIFQWKQNQKEKAVETLREAILLASPEGMIQIFMEIDGVSEMIPTLRSSAPHFVERIIGSSVIPTKSGLFPGNLPEPLSESEQKILILLIQGKTNKEIAEELFISVGTAKWHLHNIFQKMGVSNRMHAIAMAREWGLTS
jgi:LuxR family maltose regulon positive regulatory protein